MAYVSCEGKCRVGGAVQEALSCVYPVSEVNRSTVGLSCTIDSADFPSGGSHAYYKEPEKSINYKLQYHNVDLALLADTP